MPPRKALTVIDGAIKELPKTDTLEQDSRLPLDDSATTPLDSDHRILTFTEQLYGFSKQNGSILFIDKATGFMTRRLTSSIPAGSGNAFALSNQNVLFNINANVPTTLRRIDPINGSIVDVAVLTIPGAILDSFGPNAMDFDPATNILYASWFNDADGSTGHLGSVDIVTGIVTDIGKMNVPSTADGFAISPTTGIAYALVHNVTGGIDHPKADLYSINLTTGVGTFINAITGTGGFERCSSLAFDQAGTAYAVMQKNISSGTQRLVTVDLSTGVATLIDEIFYEEQFPAATSHSVTDISFRKLSAAASEFSFTQHNSNDLVHEYGVADAYKIAYHPDAPLKEAQEFTFQTSNANTDASTIDPNNKGADALVLRDGSALSSGDILADVPYRIYRDQANTRFKLLNPGS